MGIRPREVHTLNTTRPGNSSQSVYAGMRVCGVFIAAGLWFTSELPAQQASPAQLEAGPERVGSLVIAGGGGLPTEIVDRFLELGGGEQTRLVVVTTASVFAGTEEMDSRMAFWREKNLAALHVLHTRSRDEANDPEFYRPLNDATAVWFIGGNQNWLTDAYLATRTEQKLHELLERGGVIGGTSAGAAIMSRIMISGGRETPLLRTGFGFAPGMIVDQHFRKRNRQERLIDAVRQWPGHVGIGVDEATALVIRGNTLEVVGVSDVTITLAAAPGKPVKSESLTPGKTADLQILRRAALARRSGVEPVRPEVKHGTLLLVGDGVAPDEVRTEFLAAAGGIDAPILVVCTAEEMKDGNHEICRWLKSAGATNVKLLPAGSRKEAESEEFLTRLTEAKGIWLSNGPMRGLIDTYLDSTAQAGLEKLLHRGGVIAGSAAGAAVQSAAVPSSARPDELELSSEAYERGFGFLPGVAMTHGGEQPSPSADLTGLKSRYPDMIGVELQDSTALVVRGSKMQVIGKHPVTVIDRRPKDPGDYPEFSRVKPGESYDLCERKLTPVSSEDMADQ